MGIYIRAMEMPESWLDCLFANGAAQCRLVNREICSREICPIIPVPPHGRLIDADALAAIMDKQSKEHQYLRLTPAAVRGILNSEEFAKIILPADNAATI